MSYEKLAILNELLVRTKHCILVIVKETTHCRVFVCTVCHPKIKILWGDI